jgi:hypothetical protein
MTIDIHNRKVTWLVIDTLFSFSPKIGAMLWIRTAINGVNDSTTIVGHLQVRFTYASLSEGVRVALPKRSGGGLTPPLF